MPPRLVRKALNTYHHGDLRDALVQAAFQEAERGGPEAINISALAKKLGRVAGVYWLAAGASR